MVCVYEKDSPEGVNHSNISGGLLPDVDVGSWDAVWKASAGERTEANKGVLVRLAILHWVCGIIMFFSAALGSFAEIVAKEDERDKAVFKFMVSLPPKVLKEITIERRV